jgi:hypothetical protein
MFASNTETGFRITFANGWAVSVQWGGGYYCDHRDKTYGWHGDSRTAEVGVWKGDSRDIDVMGWQTPEQVAAIIAEVATRER